jgi:hypothetical protein
MKDNQECTLSDKNNQCTLFTSSMNNLRDGLICSVTGECNAARKDHCDKYSVEGEDVIVSGRHVMEKSCDGCKFKKKFIMEDTGHTFLNICIADDFEESHEGYLLAPEVSEFDGSHCGMFKQKS